MATLTANQGAMQTTYNPYGSTWRGIFGNMVNANAIAREDWIRNEQASHNQLVRDLYFQEQANAFNASEAEKSRQFNASEAQKQRDYDERMSNTQYQRMVSDLKASGLNPVLALGGSGASFHGGNAASSSPASSSGGRTSSNNQSHGGDTSAGSLLGAIASVVAGIYTAGASNAAKIATANIMAGAKNRDSTKIIYHDKKSTSISKYYH